MELQAKYVATGAFVLLVLAGFVVATLWLAGAHLNTHGTVFETHIPGSVSGLETGSTVRLNGIDVGRVESLQLDPQNPAEVDVLLEIRPDVTIRADSVASLEMHGLTGERFIQVTGGTLAAPILNPRPGQRYPTITARESSLDALFNNAPKLIDNLNMVADRLNAVLDDRNRRAIDQTLASLNELTTRLDRRSQDLDQLFADGGDALHNLAMAGATANTLLGQFQDTPADVHHLLTTANGTFDRATKLANDLDDVVHTDRPGLHELTTTVPARLDTFLTLATRLAGSLDRLSDELERNPSSILFGVNQQGYRPK